MITFGTTVYRGATRICTDKPCLLTFNAGIRRKLLSPRSSSVVVHDIIDPNYENDTLEDIDFKKWDNGFLVLEADAVKEELRFSTENLRHFMAM